MKPQLETYKQKRDFSITTEPQGGPTRKSSHSLIYVIQRHQSRHLHYDFRLEIDGVLVSWAVPKGPSLDPGVKRLAVRVEDHPLEYAQFEGNIPADQYGAGQVDIWDAGSWVPSTDAVQALQKGRLKFELNGGLKGKWLLLRTGDNDKQWLLRKLTDQHAVPGHDAERSAAPAGKPRASRKPKAAGSTSMPASMSPQLATLVSRPPKGDGWSYEVKYDGYRMLCRLRKNQAKLISRSGKDWSPRMQKLAHALKKLALGEGWIDGEVVCFDDAGISRFQPLQQALDGEANALVYVAFDLLFWNGTDLRALPLSERQARLSELLETLPPNSPIMFTQILDVAGDAEGDAAWTEACRLSLEGLICKKLDAAYTEGRSTTWLKLKCRPQQEFVIGGYTEPSGTRSHLGSLLVGVRDGKTLRYAGRVGTGFTQATLKDLHQKLSKLHRRTSPFSTSTEQSGRYGRSAGAIQWVSPKLVAEVNYADLTQDGLLRQASFKGLRQDKPASAITGEAAVDPAKLDTGASPGKHKRRRNKQPGKVNVSNPDRVIYTNPDVTKRQLFEYYQSIADLMLPHLLKRRVALLRCPRGTDATCFFQKHLHGVTPQDIVLDDEQIVIENQHGLLELIQLGVIELHTWGSSLPRADRPDRITLDLDPDPDIAWADVVTAARLVQRLMQDAGLVPYLKTTGGKGVHLVAPIKPTHTWETVKAFAHALADYLAREAPGQFTAKVSKAARKGLIFIDYLRNGNGATAVAAFSARARKGAPVSMPVAWEELTPKHDLRGAAFNIHNALRHQREQAADPWRDYETTRRTLELAFKNELEP